MLLSSKDNGLLPALTPVGVTLAVDAGWTNPSQRIVLSYPREGLHEAQIEIEGSLRQVRAVLSARDGDVEPLREAVAAVAIARASTRFQGAGLREARGA